VFSCEACLKNSFEGVVYENVKGAVIHSTNFVTTIFGIVDLEGLWPQYGNPNELWLFTVNFNLTFKARPDYYNNLF